MTDTNEVPPMVERVARALLARIERDGFDNFLESLAYKPELSCAALARAAIEAMRDTTTEMLEAVEENIDFADTFRAVRIYELRDAWSAAISAALGEKV